MPSVRIIGSYISPYVRKVLVYLDLKGLEYTIDPIVPFFGNAEFSALSPVRRIPVLIDDLVTLADSTVICEYLDDRYPEPPLRPVDPVARARARWLEEYADTRIGEVVIWGLFNQLVINRSVWGEDPDPERLRTVEEHELPEVLDYLEAQLGSGGDYLCGAFGIADIAVAAPFRNAQFVRRGVDAGRWPKTAAYLERVLGHESFMRLRAFEELSMRTPIPEQRAALGAAGAPLTPDTLGTTAPRRGVLRI